MKHRTLKGAIDRLRQYAGYIGCCCRPEVHRSRRASAHTSTCARADYIETIVEMRRLTRGKR